MRLVFLNRFFWPDHSATSQLLSDLAFYLASHRNEVTVVASRLRYEDPAARLPAYEVVQDVRVVRVWSTRFGRSRLIGRALDYLSFYVSAFLFLLFRSRSGDIVVSKTDPPLLSVLAAVVARVRRIHRVNWLQDLFPEVAQAAGLGIAQGHVGRLTLKVRDWSLKNAINVVLSERMANILRARGAQSVEIVPNWADGMAIQPMSPETNPLRAAWGLTDRFVVCYSGNLGRVHGAAAIVEAAEKLRNDNTITFLFIGGGKQSDALRVETMRRGLRNIVFHPYQPRELLGQSLTLADVHLVTLRPEFEGLVVPSKFYGVAAAGRPCIFVGDTDGDLARLIREEGCGIAVAAGDGTELAATIVMLRNDSLHREKLGAAARRVFEARFAKSILLARWQEVLRSAPISI